MRANGPTHFFSSIFPTRAPPNTHNRPPHTTMSAFDAARAGNRAGGGGPASRSGMSRGAGGGSGAFGAAAASSSSSPAIGSSYQSADRLYMTTCENIEKELRKLTANMAAARKQVEQVGTAKDTEDLRKKLCVHARGADEAPREAGGRPRAAGIAPGVRARMRRAREDRGYPAARARVRRKRDPPHVLPSILPPSHPSRIPRAGPRTWRRARRASRASAAC
jgi:hypothetical protein